MNQPETTAEKIHRWNIARGLGDLSIDDLLSDTESTAASSPTGNHHSAQGCDAGATLGPVPVNSNNPERVASERSAA